MRHLEGLSSEISLLHINCEGCEWEMLENLLKETDLIKKVRQSCETLECIFLTSCMFTGEMSTSWRPLFSRGKLALLAQSKMMLPAYPMHFSKHSVN